MEWQQSRSAFIQDNNIRQRIDTRAGNVKGFYNVPPLSQFCPPEISDKSIENRDKNLDREGESL